MGDYMPNYKRKKVKKSLFRKKRHVDTEDFVVETFNKNESDIVPKERIKLLKGSKLKRKKALNFSLVFVAVVCVITVILSCVLPVGIYENFVNYTALIGHGKYPQDISGTTTLNCVDNGSYYYVLSDTSIIAYSNKGKMVLNDLHGFSNPVISVSQTRVIVYDQGGKSAYIYNLGGRIHTYESEYDIITANIGRDGTVAFATHSDKYTSVLNVYDKNFEHVFTWNSAKDIINNVLINEKGNRVAVTTINVASGQYVSKMNILSFNSADPLFSMDLDGSLALALTNTGKGISVICNDKYKYVNWSKFNTNNISVFGEINIFRKTKNGLLLVLNRANNRADNTIILISKSGKQYKEFQINSLITDIQYSKGRIYYLSDTNLVILDDDGNVLRKGTCSYGTERFSIIASNSIATICDRKISKIDIQKGEN